MRLEYNEDFQRLMLSYLISEPNVYAQCQNILRPEHFMDRLRPAAEYLINFSNEFRAIPSPIQIKAGSRVDVELFDGVSDQNNEWFLKTFEQFTRDKAMELIILDAPDLLQKGESGEVDRRVREAMTISLMRDLGTSYFHDPKTRLERMRDRTNYVSTGWKTLDEKLYGGFTPGALNVWAGGSGSGKSLWLQNLAINWAFMGKTVVYFTLELSEDLVSMRLDSMVSGLSTKDVIKNVDKVSLAVRMKGQQAGGEIIVKKMPEAGTTSNDLRAFMKEYEIQTGKRPEACCVDYLDLMHPNNRSINPSDLFVKDKYVSEELRAFAGDYQLLFGTASQLNRQSVEATEFDHSHIAGGISKINTADNVFGIFTTAPMRERGIYQLQFLKTRSSSAVGQKIELKYDPICMRIMDQNSEEEEQRPKSSEELKQELRDKQQTQAKMAQVASTPPALPPHDPVTGEITIQAHAGNDVSALMRKLKSKGSL